MRFKNIIKKENVKYNSGDVLIANNKTLCKEEVYMVVKKCSWYNLIDLNEGQLYFYDNRHYDAFAKKVEQIFTSIEIIGNHELELVRVEKGLKDEI